VKPKKPIKRKTPRSLLLRTCGPNGESHNGFRWPLKVGAVVKAPDWNPRAECGNGLHGLLNGAGNGELLRHDKDSVWMVVSAPTKSIVNLEGKVKVPEARIEFVGDRKGATDYLIAHGAKPEEVGGAFITVGDGERAMGAAYATVTAGNDGTASAGYGGTASAGNDGTASAGYGGTASAGIRGTASAGDGGTASAGNCGTASAGIRGTASAGYGGTASAGIRGTASAGDGGTASAGDGGTLSIKYWDGTRYRIRVAYVGENGIKPNTKYRLDDKGEFVEAA